MKTKLLALIILFTSIAPAQDSKENANFKLAVNLYNDKMYDLALEQLTMFINLYPGGALGTEARFYLGLTQSKLGKHEEARSTFQNFALAYPENIRAPEAWMNVAEEYAAMKDERDAAMGFERVKTFHPNSKYAPIALLKAADCYSGLKDTDNTLRVLRILTQEYTTDEVLPARNKLAEIYISTGQLDQARQESKRVMDATRDPELKARALVLYGKAFLGLGKNAEAETALTDVTENFKSTSSYNDALLNLGTLKRIDGRTDEALYTWKSITNDSTKAPAQIRQDAFIEMAEVFDRVRSNKHALELFEKAAKIRAHRSGEALYKAGVASDRMGDHEKAAQFYKRALADSAINVDRRAILVGAIKGAAFTRNYSDAVLLINLFRQQYPTDNNLPGLLILGADAANNEIGESKTAIDFCEWLIQHFPYSEWADDAAMKIAEALKNAGNWDEAIRAFENIQRKYPSSEFVPEAQRQVRLINAFDMRNKDAGLQKLALLIGDVISQKSKGNLAYRLAEIYFNDLKDYQLAAEQYSNALSIDLEDEIRPAAWFRQAQSYELLALKEPEKTSKKKEFLAKAISLYDTLTVLYPATDLSNEAIAASFLLRLQQTDKPEELNALGADFMAKNSAINGGDIALLRLGDAYLRAKKYESAVGTYKFILEKYSNRAAAPSAQYQLGKALDGMMEKDTAVQVMENFLKKNPNHLNSAAAAEYLAKSDADSGNVYEVLEYTGLLEKKYFYYSFKPRLDQYKGDAYFNAGDFKNAYDWYIRGLGKLRDNFLIASADPEDEEAMIFKIGVCCEKLSDFSSAKKWYTDYVAMDQTSARAGQAYYSLAAIAKSDNSLDLAAKYMQEVSRITGKTGGQSAAVLLETGNMLFKNEQYADAIKRYNEALKQAQNDSVKKEIRSRVIISYFRIDNIKEAEKRAADFNKEYPHNYNHEAEFEFERGKYQLRKEDLVKAREKFAHVVHSYPKAPIVPETMFWTARLYELDQKLPLAVRMYDSLLKYSPNDPIIPRVHLSLGNAYYSLEKWDDASKQYRIIIDNEQASPDLVPLAMSNLIMVYKEMKMFDGALELTRKFIERYPNDPELIDKRIEVGVLLQKLGYFDQSVQRLQEILDEGNIDLEAELRYYIGEAYFYKGEFQQAILEFLKVPYLAGKRGKMDWISTSYYMAGQSYEKMSKYDQAITMYQQIILRKDTDSEFKIAAQKEIERVKLVVGKK